MRELLGTGAAFLNLVGSIVLAIDAQAAVRRARVKKAATDLAALLRQNAATDLLKDDTGKPINDEAAIELWLSRLRTKRALVGLVILVCGFCLDFISRLIS